MEKQVVSKKRVSDHGEVYTRKREVNAMLDLVKQETERIESRFLEPVASRSGHEHAGNPGTDGTRRVLAKTEILPPGTICTETYLVIGNYSTEQQARNLLAYMKTRFFRFLMGTSKNTPFL